MVKREIVLAVSEDTGMLKSDVKKVIESLFRKIMDCACKDEEVIFRGFGTFRATKRKKTKARDIRRGIEITCPERMTLKFFAVDSLVKRINEAMVLKVMENNSHGYKVH